MSSRPNILLIMTDQQRADTIAALGNPLIKTPALDRLVNEGTAFTQVYTPAPVCVAARCALATGQPAHITGCTDNNDIPFDLPSIMELLAGEGYQTHGTGKMHFIPDLARMWGFESRDLSDGGLPETSNEYRQFLQAEGYGYVAEPDGVKSEMYYIPQPSQLPAYLHKTAWVGDRSIEFLKNRDANRAFFLWTSFVKPHPPFAPPYPWYKLYRAAEMPPPFRPEGYGQLLNYWNRVQNRYKYRDAGVVDLLMRTIKAMYYASISFVDFQIGRILAQLGDLIDNTLILFVSDHGELLGDYGSVGKRGMLNASVRVPMLVRLPGKFAAGQRCTAPATLLDIFPTLCAAAGIKRSASDSEGVDLAKLATGEVDREVVFSQFSQGRYGIYMSATEDTKYIYSAPDNREWLFDLITDPFETRNLAGNPMAEERLAAMRDNLIQRFKKDDYDLPLDGSQWRQFDPPEFPNEPDAGLLFQDDTGLEAAIAALGEYARPVTVSSEVSHRLLNTENYI